MKKVQGIPFFDACKNALAFLRDDFGFEVVEELSKDGSVIFRMESANTGMVVEFEQRSVYPRLFLYPRSTPRRRVELNALLKLRVPRLVYPTEKTDRFLTDMVRGVWAGKRMKAPEFPEDISFEKVLSEYAFALQNALADVLGGDFSKVPTQGC
jgi:hypothetical protein